MVTFVSSICRSWTCISSGIRVPIPTDFFSITISLVVEYYLLCIVSTWNSRSLSTSSVETAAAIDESLNLP